ncbi:MAG: glycosyltransferase family 4 protein [Bacilli bacterium]|nr:glycosyltransferase family 4 protein [Bacilli bacterium]
MKILLTSDMYENQINGVSGSVITLRDELRKKGHDVRVLTLSKDSESRMEKTDYLIGSFPVPFYPDTRQTLHFKDKLIKEIIKWNPDIIHIQTEFSIGKISKKIAKACNCPMINTSHTLYEDYTGYLIPSKRLGKIIARRFTKSSYQDAKAIIAPSEKIKKLLTKYGIDKPIHIIPTGIDLDRFKMKVHLIEKSTLRAKLNIPNKAKVIVSIGRIAKEKNLDEIISFMPDLIEKDKNIILLIGGDGPYKKQIEKQVKDLGIEKNVRFTGMIPPKNTYKYYQLADLFVCASTSETQGITYIEALACSLPLVCRYDECLDGVIIDGKNGYTYKNKDEYLKYVEKILHNPLLHHKLKTNALKSSKRFSKEKFAEDIEALYKNVLKRKC